MADKQLRVLEYDSAGATDQGRTRRTNEDFYGLDLDNDEGVCNFVVCDGMGGAAAGEIASSIAVDELLRLLIASAPDGKTPEPMPARAEQAIAVANEAIYSRSQRNYKLSGMGTTMVGLQVEERRVWVMNVGDSRCYRLQNRMLQQITQDHSLVEEQVRLGRMTRLDAQRSPLRNVITRALGTQSRVTPDIFDLAAEEGDLFLLCSDGLTRELSDPVIESLLVVDQPLEVLCTRLVDAAKKAGGHDNITCILVRASE